MNWREVEFSKKAHDVLKSAMCGDDDVIIAEIEAGYSQLFECEMGYMITRNEYPELVLVAAAGKTSGKSVDVLKQWIKHAKNCGFESVRLHATREGMKKIAVAAGMRETDAIYRVSV